MFPPPKSIRGSKLLTRRGITEAFCLKLTESAEEPYFDVWYGDRSCARHQTTGIKDEPISFDPQARSVRGRVLLATLPLRAKRVCTCWQTTARFRAGRGHYTKRHKSYAKEFGLSNRGAKGTVISWRGDRPPPVQSRRVAGSRRSGASEHRSQRGGE
jgi:hypothetical protein